MGARELAKKVAPPKSRTMTVATMAEMAERVAAGDQEACKLCNATMTAACLVHGGGVSVDRHLARFNRCRRPQCECEHGGSADEAQSANAEGGRVNQDLGHAHRTLHLHWCC